MHTQNGRAIFKSFRFLLDSVFVSTIGMRRLISKFGPKKDDLMQFHTQSGNITTKFKVKIDFTLPELIATKIVTCNCHVDDSAKVRYEIILGRYLLK